MGGKFIKLAKEYNIASIPTTYFHTPLASTLLLFFGTITLYFDLYSMLTFDCGFDKS